MGLLAVEHVTKSFGATVAVKDVSFTVEPGEIFGVLGPNGAGKTTTIRMILDLIKPDSGKIAVLGGPMTEEKKNRIGYLPEERGLYRDLKVLDCMVYLAMLKGLDRAVARRRALDYLEQMGLADQQKKKISELSKGMQQKVQFGTMILHDPQLMIIDEPFSGLDPVNTLAVKEQIFALRKAGHAILMSTHQMQMVEEMCDRLVMFNRGEIVLRGTPLAVRQQFAPNAVLVEGTGPFAALPGVREVVPHNGAVELMLEPGVNAQEVLRELALQPAVTVDRFEVATPSLDEVFVRVVQGEAPREAGHA
ncbi:MAG TPA: ATP-binding cassette domain-containing protein [Chloroflexia bacterium]|nr:ATP-binding cassette domain-containing protein [Chloroflexia bacterium]